MQIRYPNITGKTPEERQDQMERFMRSMVDQLNLSMKSGTAAQTSSESQIKNGSETSYLKQIKDLEETVKKLSKEVASSLDKNHPVGSLYCSEDPTEPSTLFGGTWEPIKDKFILAAGSSYAAGSTGGEATHTLNVDETPEHRHKTYAMVQGYSGWPSYTTTEYSIIHKAGSVDYFSPGNTMNMTDVYDGLTSTVGGSQPHNNMPPYQAFYMWKRTA